MGICNVTPDSFSDGGAFATEAAAKRHVDALLDEGADILDIGGESTRPGASAVSPAEQIARVLDVVRYAAARAGSSACVSIDTSSAEVAAACLDAGACAVNDVSCLREDALARVCASSGAALILMHARGHQSEMKGFSAYADAAYGDVLEDVLTEWRRAAARAEVSGLLPDALVMDPGLGFAKNARQSLHLLRHTGAIARAVAVPVLVGASRKSFLKTVDPDAAPLARVGASLAAAVFAAREGAAIVRVHDVRATAQAIDMDRILSGAPHA